MKRKSLLFLLLALLFAPWAAQAQETVTVGDVNSTTKSYNTPFNSLYWYSFTEIIYPADEITIDNETVAGTITSVSYYLDQSYAENQTNDIVLYMKNVTRTTFTSNTDYEPVTANDVVFNGQWTIPANYTGWLTITLDTPFEYDGESNLMIAMDENTDRYSTRNFKYTNVSNSGISYYGDENKNPDPYNLDSYTSGSKALRSQRCVIQLVIEPASSDCPKPSSLVASNVTAHGATLTWEGESDNGFRLEWKKASESGWTSLAFAPNAHSYNVAYLDADTEYEARVQSTCGWDEASSEEIVSGYRETSFTTTVACPAPTNLAVTDGSITANEATLTWTGTSESYVVMVGQENTAAKANFETGDLSQADFTATTNYPFTVVANTHSGAYCAKSSNGNQDSTTSDMVLEVTLTTDMTLTFSAKVSSEANWDKAYFSIDGTDKITGISGAGNWIDYSYPLTAGTHTLRWYYTKDSSQYGNDDCFYVDDIVITAGVASWTEYTTNNTTYTFENLTPNRSYQAKVKGNCGSEGFSAETEPVSFTTLPSCFAPTGLAIVEGYPTAHGVSFTWDYETGEVFQFSLPIGNVTDPEMVTWNTTWYAGDDFPIYDNQPADTDRTFWLRKKCDDNDFSDPVSVSFHTLEACPTPTGFAAMPNSITAHTADLTWEGSSNTYYVTYGAMNTTATVLSTDFENNAIPAAMTNSTSYAWTVTAGGANNSGYCAIPGNNGVDSSDSDLSFVVTGPGTVSFYAKVSSENNYDYGRFLIDNTQKVNISGTQDWTAYEFELTAGTHTLVWRYHKDSSSASGSDLFYVDDITVTGLTVGEWQTVEATEVPFTLERLTAETSYQVTMYGDCGSIDGTSTVVGPITFTTDIACHAPTAFQVVENSVKHDQVGLTWTSNATAWQLCLNGNEDNLIDIEEDDVTINEGVVTYTLTGLTATTEYTAKLRANCGGEDGVSEWTSSQAFTTSEECPTPTNLTISNIGHFTANATWAGESESFKVTIGTISETTPFNTQNFENESLEAFTNDETNAWVIWNENPNNGSFCMASGNYNVSNSTATITLTAEFASDGIIEFYSRVSSEGGTYDYGYFSIDGEEQYREGGETPNVWTKRSYEVSAGTHTFSWSYRKDSSVNKGEDRYFIDDIVLSTTTYAWTTYTTQDNAYSFEGLEAGTIYKVKVSPSCDETTASNLVSFTTVSENEKYFLGTESDEWLEAGNWEPVGAPTIAQNVTLFANVTITGEATANTITGTGTSENNFTLTIEDGGKLKHSNANVYATVKKHINGYTNYEGQGNGGYYLIANPITSNYTPTEANGFLAGNYDLYSWDYTNADEWRNYEANTFSILNSGSYNSYGYLYANENGTDLTFTGTIKSATASLSRSCSATTSTSYDFPGLFLLGNSFVCDAYLAAGSATGNALPCYKMNEAGDGYTAVAAGEAIAPLEGVFFQASSEEGGFSGYVYVTTTEPTVQSKGQLNMNLRSNNKQLDNAIVVFGKNQSLGKVSFRANSSKVYMPQDGKDFAIVSTESSVGEMPVNFKAENNGTYTLSFNADEVSFAYLHLIDNMTGNETDLLANPSYTFEASSTDYESRFKLVFATGNNSNEDNFAYYSNGNWVINNEGLATLQVVDVNGRILKSESINGCANINVNAAAGIYMIRLVNGDNVKVQKVVVR